MSAEVQEPGQLAYETWRGPKVEVFGRWEKLMRTEKASWAAVEQACATALATVTAERDRLREELARLRDRPCMHERSRRFAMGENTEQDFVEAGKGESITSEPVSIRNGVAPAVKNTGHLSAAVEAEGE